MTCDLTAASDPCPCGTPAFPLVICNPAQLPAIGYRVGDYLAFRHRLLQALPGEVELTSWRPGAENDLAVQMVEWWAYLADILTFYSERYANEAYLGTAVLPESVAHLVQILGYRPRPALGARGRLAALISHSARTPFVVPARVQIQSKPPPGQAPQVFEVDADTTVRAPDVISAVVSPPSPPLLPSDGSSWVWLQGKVSGVKAGDRLLLTNATAVSAQALADYAWIKVAAVASETTPTGAAVTRLDFAAIAGAIAGGAAAADYLLLKPQQSSPLWPYPTSSTVLSTTSAALAGVARGLTPGSLLLLDVSDASASGAFQTTPAIVTSYAEAVWYANAPAASGGGPGDAGTPPASSAANPVPAIGIPRAQVGFGALSGGWANSGAGAVTVRWGWTRVGDLVPALVASDLVFSGAAALAPVPGAAAFPATPASVLLEDANGGGASAVVKPSVDQPGAVTVGELSASPPAGLASPIDVLFDLLVVSRGKTVPAEVLGSGNPVIAGQDFALAKSPVTYFADPASNSGDGFSSTVKVSVNGVLWREVRSFYGQAADAQVFVLREDDQGRTHVTFGDAVNGARLPTGVNNVVATYRYGAGAAAPPADTLTSVLTPTPGLKGVRNPLPPTGGADADPPSKLVALAPRSVLTFNRAVSLDDYAVIAAGAQGVTQAVADLAFDALSQRPVVTLWVAGDDGSLAAATAAIAAVAVPYQGLRIHPAKPVEATLRLGYLRDSRYADADVQAGLTSALLDPDKGLLGANVIGIGAAVYESQISAACLAVPGVMGIEDVRLTSSDGLQFTPLSLWFGRLHKLRLDGPGCFGRRHSPGEGRYFSVPNDGQHLFLREAAAP